MKKTWFGIILVLLVIVVSLFLLKDKSVIDNVINKVNLKKSTDLDKQKESIESGLTLDLVSPKNNTIYNQSLITITGMTSSNVEVFVNNKETVSDSNGNFSVEYELDEGENSLHITANDNLGNYTEKTITVFLESSE
jgi:hypothetical protein